MSQPYLGGQPLTGLAPGAAAQALGAHLRRTDAAIMSRSSHLYAMISSDDPFQYLGGLAAAARSAGKAAPLALYASQLQDTSEATTETAQRSIAREMQSRYLHPGWLQAQQAEGYAGTLQVLKAVQYAWGWQSVAPDTVRPDHWQSFYEVLVEDRHRLGLPQWLRSHPQAYAQALERLVQAQRHGHWQPDTATRRALARLYDELTTNTPLTAELPAVRRWIEDALNAATTPAPAAKGLAIAGPAALPPPAAMSAPGILLQRQADEPAVASTTQPAAEQLLRVLLLLLMAALVGGGAAWQACQQRHTTF